MHFLSLMTFALAINIDSLITGISYGMQQIKLPFFSRIVVSAISALMIFLSMLIGISTTTFLPTKFIDILSSLLLAFIGFYRIISVIRNNARKKEKKIGVITSFRIPFLCIAVQILREPEKADANSDGTLDGHDAIMLGTALALDSVAAGFAIALAGFPILNTALLCGITTFFFLSASYICGKKFINYINKYSAHEKLLHFFNYLPGILLIFLAFWRIIIIISEV